MLKAWESPREPGIFNFGDDFYRNPEEVDSDMNKARSTGSNRVVELEREG